MLNRSQTTTNADHARAISAETALLRKQGLQNFSLALSADRVGNVGVSAPTADRQTQAAPVLESGIAT